MVSAASSASTPVSIHGREPRESAALSEPGLHTRPERGLRRTNRGNYAQLNKPDSSFDNSMRHISNTSEREKKESELSIWAPFLDMPGYMWLRSQHCDGEVLRGEKKLAADR